MKTLHSKLFLQDFLIVEDLASDLYNEFPEYKRLKYKVFLNNVQKIIDFEKNKEKSAGNIVTENNPVLDITSDSGDESGMEHSNPVVKGPSLNKTLSDLYSTNYQELTDNTNHDINSKKKIRKIDLNPNLPQSTVLNGSSNPNCSTPKINYTSIHKVSTEAEMIDISMDDSLSNNNQQELQSSLYVTNGISHSRITNKSSTSYFANQQSSISKSALKHQIPVPAQTPAAKQKAKGFAKNKIGVVESKVTFADLGGMNSILIKVLDLLLHLKHPEIYEHIGVVPPRGFLLHGPPGCGKTLLANAIAGQLKLPLIKLAATEIVSGVSGESESKLRDLFDEAKCNAPCILFIDEIDAITQRRDNANKGMESRIVGQLLSCMDDLNEKSSINDGHVVVIGATNRPDTLDPALRRAGRFEREICLGIPDEKSRAEILKVMTAKLNLKPELNINSLARKCPGYVGADMSSLCREAATKAVNRIFKQLQSTTETPDSLAKPTNDASADKLKSLLNWLDSTVPLTQEDLSSVSIDMADFDDALRIVQPSAKREGFATVPDVTWDDIGALNDVRDELELSILAPVNHPEVTKALGLESPSGILLCGPPGCGKTLLAKAVANQAGINFISVKGPELLNMYVGESERAVRQVFQRARNSAPCVIFFDEIDALCPRRSSSSGGENSARVVNQLLTEMDGLESRGQGVFVMGATNRVDILDPAVLRPGRLQKILFVDLPSPSDRVDILRAITRHGTRPKLAPDVDFDALAHSEECEFFTGADMAALVTEAANAAFKEHILMASRRGKQNGDAATTLDIKVSAKHFRLAFTKVRPSVSIKDRKKYDSMKKLYSISKSSSSSNIEADNMSCDEDDELGMDRVISEDREHSLSQCPFGEGRNMDNTNTVESEFSTKDSIEADRIETDENEQEQVPETHEDKPIQVECDSSPSNSEVQISASASEVQNSQTPSPSQVNREVTSPEPARNIN